MEKELQIVEKKIKGMEDMVSSLTITNPEELSAVSDKIKQVKTLKKYIEQEMDKNIAPAKLIIKNEKDKYEPFIEKCEDAERKLKMSAQVYMEMQEKIRRDEEKKIAEKLEVERKKIEEDLAKGKISQEKADEKIEAKTEKAADKLATVVEAPKNVNTENSGLFMKKRKVAYIIDATKVPDEFWLIDEVKVKKEALRREKEGLPQVEGMEVREENSMTSI